ncbi:MAG: DNA replication/repair protein RecF [Proteobacteria bacterium]|nr:DNA replication/repair protein RecF [Pseudomonadota bacterium]
MSDNVSDHAITRLTLTEFRCYPSLRLEVGPSPIVLTGANGAGKTNLLEAISFLAPGRGLRGARLADITRTGSTGRWGVSAHVRTAGTTIDVGTASDAQVSASPGHDDADPGDKDSDDDVTSQRRVVKIDGALAPQSALAGTMSITWLVPQMDRLFIESAGGRRRFFDRLAYGFDPDHAKRINAYERVSRQRSRLLRDRVHDDRWLAALEETMAEHAVAIGATRRDTLSRLERGFAMAQGPFPRARLNLSGWVEDALHHDPALTVENALRERWAALREVDAAAGRATVGVHRTDMLVWLEPMGTPAAQCSTGEQKALLVAIVLAQARVLAARQGYAPILLLDEIVAHLDANRRETLLGELLAMGTQAWLSGTDPEQFVGLSGGAQFFGVTDGAISPIKGP